MINKPRYTQIVITYYVFFGIEHLSHLKSHLRLLKGAGKILDSRNGGTYPHVYSGEKLAGKRVGNGTCKLFKILYVNIVLYFLYKHNVVFGNVEHKILVLVREEILYHVVGGNIVRGNYVHKEHHSVYIRVKMKFTGFYSDISGQNVVENDVLDEVVSVVFFVIVLLNAGKRNSDYRSVFCRRFVGAFHENHIIGSYMDTKRFVSVSVLGIGVVSLIKFNGKKLVCGAYFGQITASDDSCIFVDNTDNSVDCVLHLVHDTLKQSV